MNEEILQNINTRLEEALEKGREIVEDEELEHRIEQLKSRAEKFIKEHPVKSIAAGFTVGYILGKIFSSDE